MVSYCRTVCLLIPCVIVVLVLVLPAMAADSRERFVTIPNGVSTNGWLKVREGKLVNEHGEPVRLRGMSSHGLQWFPEYINARAMQTLAQYGANVFRAAMYADSVEGGYNESKELAFFNNANLLMSVENALASDMYAVADWHILKDQNPLHKMDAAVDFFDRVSLLYKDEPGVLYEICNEPNGETTWDDVVTYANTVIPVIRKNSPNAIIIVGTPKHSTDLQPAFEKPLEFDNIMYTLHIYTEFMDGPPNHDGAMNKYFDAAMPIFVSEWGIGEGEDALERGALVLDIFDKHGLSWINWSLCNKDEPYSAIKPDVKKLSGWTEDDLTASGKLVFSRFRDK